MLLLALDTSAAVGAAVHDGGRLLAERSVHDPRRHAELLAPMLTEVLAAAGAGRSDVTDVAVGAGPGPFTGLRVGLVTARTLGHVFGVGVHAVCSLDALAAAAADAGLAADGTDVVVLTDARRREVYSARYRVTGGVAIRTHGPEVGPADAVDVAGAVVVGRGAGLYADRLAPGATAVHAEPADPAAGAVAAEVARRLAAGEVAEPGGAGLLPPDPLYLRRPDVATPGPPKRVRS